MGNAWGLVIAALGVGILWWAKQQSGTLDGVLGDITGAAGNVVKTTAKSTVKAATNVNSDIGQAPPGDIGVISTLDPGAPFVYLWDHR